MHIHERGRSGEDLAAGFLTTLNYKILERNWKHDRNEVDIICIENNVLVFVEVKTRSCEYFGLPEDSVDKKKMAAISKTANAYLALKKHQGEIRFDIVSVIIPLTVLEHEKNGNLNHLPTISINRNLESIQIHHIPDAFFPGL